MATKTRQEAVAVEARRPLSSGAVGSAVSRVKEARAETPEVLSRPADGPPEAVAPRAVGRSVLGNEAERRYVEAIQTLKEGIEKEQYTVRMLQALWFKDVLRDLKRVKRVKI